MVSTGTPETLLQLEELGSSPILLKLHSAVPSLFTLSSQRMMVKGAEREIVNEMDDLEEEKSRCDMGE